MPRPFPQDLRVAAIFSGGIGLGAYQGCAYAPPRELRLSAGVRAGRDRRTLLGEGGLSANAPIEAVLFDDRHDGDRVCFVIDLFAPDGRRPKGLETALARKNDLMFANQTRLRLEALRRELDLAFALDHASQTVALEAREAARALLAGRSRIRALLHLSYRAPREEAGPEKMFDLSKATANDRWHAGALDMAEAVKELSLLSLESRSCELRVIRRTVERA